MPGYIGLLKGYQVLVHYRDGSRYTTEFKNQTEAMTFLETLNLTETYSTTISPVWSKPGEVVELEVHTFPPAGD